VGRGLSLLRRGSWVRVPAGSPHIINRFREFLLSQHRSQSLLVHICANSLRLRLIQDVHALSQTLRRMVRIALHHQAGLVTKQTLDLVQIHATLH